MITAAIIWLAFIAPANAEDCAPGLYPCEVEEAAAEAEDILGTIADTGAPGAEPASDVEPVESLPDSERGAYWYEPLTDVFWWPAEALAWVGLLGADHVDAAALTAWIAAVAAGAHRLWMWMWMWIAPIATKIRQRLGLAARPAKPERERLDGISEADREYMQALIQKESETCLTALRTQIQMEHQRYLDQSRRTDAAVAALEQILSISASASGNNLEEP